MARAPLGHWEARLSGTGESMTSPSIRAGIRNRLGGTDRQGCRPAFSSALRLPLLYALAAISPPAGRR